MTVHDALEARSIDLGPATEALTAALPVGRTVTITPEVIEAAIAGDVGLLTLLFAEEVEPDEIDLAMLHDVDATHEGAISADELRRELGIAPS